MTTTANPAKESAPTRNGERRSAPTAWYAAIFVVPAALALALVVLAPPTVAYDTYSTSRGAGNCADCHGDFRTAPYTSLSDGQSWGDDLHDVHRNTMLGGDCSTCHAAASRFPVAIGSSAGGTGLPAYGCVGCHGRAEDGAGGGTLGFGAGLRQHHNRAGETSCVSCHDDSDPANKTLVGENTLPPYYANPGTNHPNMPANTCDPAAARFENFAGSARGLDNDGDSMYDLADSDCAATSVCGNGQVEPGESCDDGNTTAGDCCSATCQFEAPGSACSDGLFCTIGESCNGGGACAGGTALDCTDLVACTADSCNETIDACAHVPDDAVCSDGDLCNGAETCTLTVGCVAGTPLACDDGNVCTTDSCSPATGCAHVPLTCSDGVFCNGLETCHPSLGCQAGTPPDCSDTDVCTDDSCNPTLNACDHVVDPTNDPSCLTPPEANCFDGVDDDGDGAVDCADSDCEGARNGPCPTGQPGECAAGTFECRNLSMQCIANVSPQPEICADALDNDCDGLVDTADPDCQVATETDCFDGVDNDGDGSTDCADPDCAGARDGTCTTGLPGVCEAGTFECAGGVQVCTQNAQPGQEICDDGLDNDCDVLVDTADPDCPATAADVWLEDLRVPKKVNRDQRSAVRRQVVVAAEGDLKTQQATVTLTYVPINAVTVSITPASLTLPVKPGNGRTQFKFATTITCNQPGEWSVVWTATITAPENHDAFNDTLSDRTHVTCRSRGGSDDHDSHGGARGNRGDDRDR